MSELETMRAALDEARATADAYQVRLEDSEKARDALFRRHVAAEARAESLAAALAAIEACRTDDARAEGDLELVVEQVVPAALSRAAAPTPAPVATPDAREELLHAGRTNALRAATARVTGEVTGPLVAEADPEAHAFVAALSARIAQERAAWVADVKAAVDAMPNMSPLPGGVPLVAKIDVRSAIDAAGRRA